MQGFQTIRDGGMQPGDWRCLSCATINFRYRLECYRCKKPRTSTPLQAMEQDEQKSKNHGVLKSVDDPNIISRDVTTKTSKNIELRQATEHGQHGRSLANEDDRAHDLNLRPGDWRCACGAHNFARRKTCVECNRQRTDDRYAQQRRNEPQHTGKLRVR